MTIKSETTLTETVTTNVVRTVGGTFGYYYWSWNNYTQWNWQSSYSKNGGGLIFINYHTHTDPAGVAGNETKQYRR